MTHLLSLQCLHVHWSINMGVGIVNCSYLCVGPNSEAKRKSVLISYDSKMCNKWCNKLPASRLSQVSKKHNFWSHSVWNSIEHSDHWRHWFLTVQSTIIFKLSAKQSIFPPALTLTIEQTGGDRKLFAHDAGTSSTLVFLASVVLPQRSQKENRASWMMLKTRWKLTEVRTQLFVSTCEDRIYFDARSVLDNYFYQHSSVFSSLLH